MLKICGMTEGSADNDTSELLEAQKRYNKGSKLAAYQQIHQVKAFRIVRTKNCLGCSRPEDNM